MNKDKLNTYINDYNNLNKLSKSFVFDTETYGLKFDELTLKDISFFDGENAFYFDKEHLDKNKLRNLFLESELIIGQNLCFDFTVLTKYFGRYFLFELTNKKLFDTMIAQYCLDENAKKGLKVMSKQILKEEMVEYKDALNTDKWQQYSINDSIQTYKLYLHFKDKVYNDQVFQRELNCILPIVDMQFNGFLIDKNKLNIIKDKLEEKLKIINNNFIIILNKYGATNNNLFGVKSINLDINSSTQLKKFINEKLKLEVENTSVEALDNIKKNDTSGFVELLLKYRHAFKLYNSYITPLINEHIQEDGYIHPSYNATGTVTGRFSSERPNMQQIPAFDELEFRDMFVAREGYSIVAADYASQELRLLGIITKDKNILEAFKNNKDLHLTTANSIFSLGIPEECLSVTNERYNEYKNKFGKERKIGKVINFASSYGAGKQGISKLTDKSVDESEQMLNKFFSFYFGIKRTMKKTEFTLMKNYEVENVFGRKRRFKEIDNSAKRQAFNFLIQSMASDMMKIDLYNIWNNIILKHKDKVYLKATIHDEILFEVDDNYLDEITLLIKKEMEDFNFEIPMIVDVNHGKSYKEAH
jgi:DNA polymerase-1